MNQPNSIDENVPPAEAPMVGQWEPVETSYNQTNQDDFVPFDMSVYGDDLDGGWQDYWARFGESLVWQGWVEKYPECIDYEKLGGVIPTLKEEEVGTIDENIISEQIAMEEQSHPISEAEDNQFEVTQHSENLTVESSSFSARNKNIEQTMKEVTEKIGSVTVDEQPNSSASRIHMFHDYCSPPGGTDMQDESILDNTPETPEKQNFDEQWKALWDEHYMETYWYYLNQFKFWFGGKDEVADEIVVEGCTGEEQVYILENTDDSNLDGESEVQYVIVDNPGTDVYYIVTNTDDGDNEYVVQYDSNNAVADTSADIDTDSQNTLICNEMTEDIVQIDQTGLADNIAPVDGSGDNKEKRCQQKTDSKDGVTNSRQGTACRY